MRYVAVRVTALCWLAAVWVALWGNVTVANVVVGLILAAVLTLTLPLPKVPVEGRLHPLSLLALIAVVTWYLLLSSVQVAWLAVRPGPQPLSAVLRAPLAVKSDFVLALAVNVMNIIPGSLVLEIDQERRLIYAHVLDVGNDKAVSQFYAQSARIASMLVRAFERDGDWRPAAGREAQR